MSIFLVDVSQSPEYTSFAGQCHEDYRLRIDRAENEFIALCKRLLWAKGFRPSLRQFRDALIECRRLREAAHMEFDGEMRDLEKRYLSGMTP